MSGSWASEPGSVVALILLAALYVAGLRRAHGAGVAPARTEAAWFALGWTMLFVALDSPLHPAGERLVSAHMAQHSLLLLAPLSLTAARTGTRILQALAPTWRGQVARWMRRWEQGWFNPASSLVLLVGTAVVWHVPPLFELAVRVPLLHGFEHLSLVAVAALHWPRVLGAGRRRREAVGPALASVFVLFVAGTVTGVLFAFSSLPLYPGYAARAVAEGSDWLLDQQLAGVLMSVPMGLAAIGMGAGLVWRWAGSAGLRGPTPARAPASAPQATAQLPADRPE